MGYKSTYRRKPRKTYRKKKMMVCRCPKDPIYRFKRTEQLANMGISGNTISFNASSFSLAGLTNYTEFTNLFDAYRITGVKLTFVLMQNTLALGANYACLPVLGLCFDYDDGSTPTSAGQLMQYQNFRMKRLDKIYSVYFKPRVLTNAIQGTSGTGYGTMPSKTWISNSMPTAQYFSAKWYVDTQQGASTSPMGALNIYAKVYIECKNPL